MTYSKNPSRENEIGFLYTKGKENLDGSIRLSINPFTLVTKIEERQDGIWQPSSFEAGPESVWVGPRVKIGAVGRHLTAQDTDGLIKFYSHSDFDGELSTNQAKMLNAYNFTPRDILYPDESGEFSGNLYTYTYDSPDHGIIKKAYFKTGSIPASSSVRIQIWEGADETGPVVFDREYAGNLFLSDSEVEVFTVGYLEFNRDKSYYFKISSDNVFSLKTSSDQLRPWLAADISLVSEDDMLQASPYRDGDLFTEGQWAIQNRKIYECNVTGIQSGTFEDNSDKWDLLTTNAGVMFLTDYDSNEDGTVDNSDNLGGNDSAYHLDLGNSTGTIPASKVADFDNEVENNLQVSDNTTHRGRIDNPHSVNKDDVGLGNVDNLQQIPLTEKGSSLGVAELDGSGKVPASQLPASVQGGIRVIGFWNADTNTPDLSALTLSQGEAYQVSVDGNTSLNGETNWLHRDLAVWEDGIAGNWFKMDNTDDVLSVAGKTGAVLLDTGDISEASNLYYTEGRVSANPNVSANTTHRSSDGKDHSDVVLNNGHRASTSNPHNVQAEQIPDFDTEVSNNADVAANATHRTSDGKGHSDVVLNNAHRGVVVGNPHAVTKSEVGLGNVDNVQQIPLSQKGLNNGVAELDGSGKVPASQLPNSVQGGIKVIGVWDADTNTPDLSALALDQGQAYQVNIAGPTSLNGETNWRQKDLAVWDDTLTGNWYKIDNTDDVLSVNGQTGAVALTDVTDLSLHSAAELSDITSAGSGQIITTPERTNLNNQSGTNTGDQDLSAFATKTQINNTTGYANYLDSSTASSPRSYALDTEAPLINDKTYPDGARYPDGVTSYWDSVNCKFTPDQADGNYAFSVNFHAYPVERDKRLIVKFVAIGAGSGGSDIIVQERLVRLQKDTGEITPVSLSFTTGIPSAIIATGVSVTLEFQDTAAVIYDITCGLAKVGGAIV